MFNKLILVFILFFNFTLYSSDNIKIFIISKFPEDNDVIDSVNLAFANYYKKHKPDFYLNFKFLNDSWTKEKIKSAIKIAVKESKYIIFTSTSTSFMEIYDYIKNKDVLIFASGPTTTEISNIDDNVIRNISDTENEQKQIANFINKKMVRNLLILKDNEFNPDYSDSALKYFVTYFKGDIKVADFSGKTLIFNSKNIINFLKNYHNIYILAGGCSNSVGLLINYIIEYNNECNIYLTPWNEINIIKKIVKDSKNIYIPTYIPENQKIKEFKKEFFKITGHFPNFVTSYLAYEIVQIISKSFQNSDYHSIKKIKKYILSHRFDTIFGIRKFNIYGDSSLKLYFHNLSK